MTAAKPHRISFAITGTPEERRRQWKLKPLKVALPVHGGNRAKCLLCGKEILIDEQYREAGKRNRAHENCVNELVTA